MEHIVVIIVIVLLNKLLSAKLYVVIVLQNTVFHKKNEMKYVFKYFLILQEK